MSRKSSRSKSKRHHSGRSSHHRRVLESEPINVSRPNPVRQLHRVDTISSPISALGKPYLESTPSGYIDSLQYKSDYRMHEPKPYSQAGFSNDLIGDYSGRRKAFQQSSVSGLQIAGRRFEGPRSDIDDVISRVLQKTFN